MCGRFGVELEYVKMAQRYQATIDVIDPGPRFNVAPTQSVAVVLEQDETRHLTHRRWGLVPPWAKDLAIGNRMINARAETVATQPAFRDAFVQRRCIVPATRFYEWQGSGREKVPHSIQRTDGDPMSLAGLWESWWDREHEERVLTCTIITTAPNDVMRPLHDRMPAILDDEDVDAWLDADLADRRVLQSLLRTAPDDLLYTYPVSSRLNSPRNEGPVLVERAEPAPSGPAQGELGL